MNTMWLLRFWALSRKYCLLLLVQSIFGGGDSRWYATCLGFWAIGCILASISNLASMTFPVLGALMFPIPWNTSWYVLINSFVDFSSFIPLIRLILSSFVSLRFPVASNIIMPRSVSVSLPIKGRLSMCPLTTINFVLIPLFLFRIIDSNSLFTDNCPCIVFTRSELGFNSLIFVLLFCVLDWYSSIMFAEAPLPGFQYASISLIFTFIVL